VYQHAHSQLYSPIVKEADISSLVRLVTGGAPASTIMIEQYMKCFSVGVVNGWGERTCLYIQSKKLGRQAALEEVGFFTIARK